MRKITFAEYEKNRPFFSNPYYVDCVKRAEERFFNVPAEKIHDAAVELPQNAEGSLLTGPCLVFMSDGTEWEHIVMLQTSIVTLKTNGISVVFLMRQNHFGSHSVENLLY